MTRRTVREASWGACLILLALLPQALLAAAEAPPAPGRATIHPSVIELAPGEEQQFKVVLMATRLKGAEVAKEVLWSVNGIPGGTTEFGTIDATGAYRAPAKTPTPREIHIGAETSGAGNRHLWATVLMDGDGPAYELVDAWGEPARDADHFVDPHCVALDRDGNLIVADYMGSRVLRFSPNGKYLGDIGERNGEEPGQVMLPRVVQMGPEGNIYISDQKSDQPRIQVFSPEGKFLRIFADKGTGPGHILRAHGLAFDSRHRLFVVDVDNMRVNVYDRAGTFLDTWGRDGHKVGEFNAPHGIVLDPNDDVFVVGYYGPCQKFTADGDFLFDFAHGDPPDGAVYFHSITGDRWGNVYLMVRGAAGYGGAIEDNEGNIVSLMKYNNNGDYVCSLTLEVKAHSENWAVVDDSGKVYAIFKGNERMGIEIFAPR